MVGGRDVEGNRILNRATSSARQPGSTIKPLAAYLPALDNGYTAATPIDDIPFMMVTAIDGLIIGIQDIKVSIL